MKDQLMTMSLFGGTTSLQLLYLWLKIYITNSKCSPSAQGCPILVQKIEAILNRRPYYPPFYALLIDYHGQAQSMLQTLIRSTTSIFLTNCYKREVLCLDDGGVIALDWIELPKRKANIVHAPSQSIVIINHGLCGDSTSEYLVHVAAKLLQEGYRVVAVVGRGVGGLPLKSLATFSGKRVKETDIAAAVNYIANANPSAALFGLGFSLGAAQFLCMLGDQQAACKLTAAVCVSPPWDFLRRTKVMSIWSPILTLPLKLYGLLHFHILRQKGVTLFQLLMAWDLDAVDHLLIELTGYTTVEEYRRHSSPIRTTHNIVVPTLAISAVDDPACCVHGVPSPLLGTSAQPQTPFWSHKRSSKTTVNSNRINEGTEDDFARISLFEESGKGGPGLVVVKTPLGGHLGFPCLHVPAKTNDSVMEPTWSMILQSVLSPFLNTWTDEVILDWFRMHNGPNSGSKTGANGGADVTLSPSDRLHEVEKACERGSYGSLATSSPADVTAFLSSLIESVPLTTEIHDPVNPNQVDISSVVNTCSSATLTIATNSTLTASIKHTRTESLLTSAPISNPTSSPQSASSHIDSALSTELVYQSRIDNRLFRSDSGSSNDSSSRESESSSSSNTHSNSDELIESPINGKHSQKRRVKSTAVPEENSSFFMSLLSAVDNVTGATAAVPMKK